MRWVQLNVPKSLTLDCTRRPTAAGTFVINALTGGSLQASSAPTLDAVNTTLTAAAAAGVSTVAVTSAVGIVVGRRYLLGGAESLGGEMVTVRSIALLVVTLVRPLRAAQASGATFQGTRLTFAVGAGAITTPGRARRIAWTPAAGDEDLAAAIPFDVVRYCPVTALSTEDLRDLDPLLAKRLSAGTWLPAVCDNAWSVLLGHITQKLDPGGVVGTVDLTLAHGYLTRSLLAETAGQDAEMIAYREMLQIRYTQERDNALATLSYDAAQTGRAKTGPGGWAAGTVKVYRG